MEVILKVSNDGSNTLFVPSLNEHYHSTNGAITEALHVYIKEGLQFYLNSDGANRDVNILEIGFGTGLNALVTALDGSYTRLNYDGLELNPLSLESTSGLHYFDQLGGESEELFAKITHAQWDVSCSITDSMSLRKIHQDINCWQSDRRYQVVYFDAFAPEVQPEMWEPEVLSKIAELTLPNGVLTTYCAKGEVRRRLQAVGFKVYRIPGPPGKREMIRAVKI